MVSGAPESWTMGVALLMSSDRYWLDVRPGRAASSKAAAPATIGAEKLVPSSTTKPELRVAVLTDWPTATMSGLIPKSLFGPRLEKVLRRFGLTETACTLKSTVTEKEPPASCCLRFAPS